ncbi:hypothetical protein MJO29_001318 [Puccinia striiformis f. sp. tritici]|nr:hypothetical protein MJO29_001318 [Puccinia striiformis f. sp. tritici]
MVGRVGFTTLLVYILPIFFVKTITGNAVSNSKRQFINVENGSFFKSCSRHYLVSMNYWSAMNLAADDDVGGNLTRFKIEVKQLAEMGVNNVRIMAASEAAGHPPYRMYPALMHAPDSEKMYIGLDRALNEFSRYDISVVMTLNNFWHWSGGYAQYVSWATNNSQIPYTSSWDPSLNPPYGNWSNNGTHGKYNPATGNWDGFNGYAGRFYNDSSITNLTQTWFRNHIHNVVHRVNTINGVVYKDDPTIMTWELTNEPQDPPVKWVEETSTYIKSIAPNHLVTVGFEGKNGEWWFKRVHAPHSIDYSCGHLWVQNWGFYDPLDPSEKSLERAKIFANEYLRNLSKWTLDLKKPIVLEEFGMARDNWLNVKKGAPTKHYLYELSSSLSASAATTHKDDFFEAVISQVVDYFQRGAGWQGTGQVIFSFSAASNKQPEPNLFLLLLKRCISCDNSFGCRPWAYGGIWRPTDLRNHFNGAWAGDPPHEPPGWYDLYDTDPTIEIIRKQAQNVTKIIESFKKNSSNLAYGCKF